jgi:dienelactone hydrolase
MQALSTLTFLAAMFAASVARAEIKTQAIEYKDGDVVLEGFLVFDDAVATKSKLAPGVVVYPEWWGTNDYPKMRAKKLAQLGYVAFAADMYGKGKITEDPKQAGAWAGEFKGDAAKMQKRVQAAFDVLTKQPMVDKTRLAAIGYCFGGTCALELARTGAPLKSVVAFHAGQLSAGGSEKEAQEANSKIHATLTICHGQADGFVPAEEIAKFHAQMKAAKIDYQFTSYADAVHAFTNPDADKFKIPGIAYNAKADARSWELMKSAFVEAFAK